MKRIQQLFLSALLALCVAAPMAAQEVNSTILLEMAPYRHVYNPAFEPITDGYFYFPILSHINLYGGNNSLTMSDLLINKNGQTMWTLNPNSGVDLLSAFRKNTLVRANTSMAILGFGARLKNEGYLHFNIDANVDAGVNVPKGIFNFLLGGGMTDLNGVNSFNLKGLGVNAQAYLALAVGYSKQENDQWTWGLKVKLLDGVAYAGMRQKALELQASPEKWGVYGRGYMQLAGPFESMPEKASYDSFNDWANSGNVFPSDWHAYLKPNGMGAAFDLGAVYQPHEKVKISFSLTDVGAIYWYKGARYQYIVDGTYDGVGQLNFNDYYDQSSKSFDTNRLSDTITTRLKNVYETALQDDGRVDGFLAPLTMKLNVGVDGYFCNNILGLGLYSRTMLYNAKVYEEVTVGAAVRPCNWFNFAMSYSFLNGKWDNLGAAIGLRGGPFALTLAADYVPMTWVRDVNLGEKQTALPYKAKGLNVELGLGIVWGWKKKDSDKDGILDKFDMCPKTPKGVHVDDMGCPIDTDGDGVPDYLDLCPATPASAYGLIDDHGCPIDTDGDGIADYQDECPGTTPEMYGFIDEKGCPLDSDGDGVPDYLDKCPNTLPAAIGYVDADGCDLDSDGDGVPDYLDRCPNTPAEAYGMLDEYGCPVDTDGDGVPDYLDKCPNTPAEAIGYVDAEGCELDSDGDGVMDYCDLCPHLAGPKANKGCPAMKKEVSSVFKKAMQGIQFETGKAVIKASSNGILDQIAQIFLENGSWSAEVQGHTDNVGKADANLLLSDKRANAVRDYLINKGVEGNRLTARGYGDKMPIADNKTAKGRTTNRRVEFAVSYEVKSVETVNQYADPVPAPADSVAPVATDSIAPIATDSIAPVAPVAK